MGSSSGMITIVVMTLSMFSCGVVAYSVSALDSQPDGPGFESRS